MSPFTPNLAANWITFAKTVARTKFHLSYENASASEIELFQSEGKSAINLN
jgi:hypothetical protein